MRRLIVTLTLAGSLAGLCGGTEARAAKARPEKPAPSIMVEEAMPKRAMQEKAARPRPHQARRTRIVRTRPAPRLPSILYDRAATVRRQEINDVGRNLRLRSDAILRRQQVDMQRQTEINLLRRDIERGLGAPGGSPLIGCIPGSLRC